MAASILAVVYLSDDFDGADRDTLHALNKVLKDLPRQTFVQPLDNKLQVQRITLSKKRLQEP